MIDEHKPMKRDCILVIGVGGGGCNTLQHSLNEGIEGVEFVAVNTDAQVLKQNSAPTLVQIGVNLTGGLGAGCDPNIGEQAAVESKNELDRILQGASMVFITAGMGGGTGTGAAPVIARIAKSLGALTVAVVTKPFDFEGKRHALNAEAGISELSKYVDSLVVVENNKLLHNLPAGTGMRDAFKVCDDVLYRAVHGITELCVTSGFVNVDFNDVKLVLADSGYTMMGSGSGKGTRCVDEAIAAAINSPIIDPVAMSTATGLLVNVRMSPNFPISLYDELCSKLESYASDASDGKFGITFDESMDVDEVKIIVLLTGVALYEKAETKLKKGFFERSRAEAQRPPKANLSPLSDNAGARTDVRPQPDGLQRENTVKPLSQRELQQDGLNRVISFDPNSERDAERGNDPNRSAKNEFELPPILRNRLR